MSEQIRQRRNEALHIAREREVLLKDIKELEDQVTVISEQLVNIRNGEQLERRDLAVLGLEQTSPSLIRLRLQGLLNERKGKLENLRLRQLGMDETLKNLTVCPSCKGRGNLSESHYQRDNGNVFPSVVVKTCPICKGTGNIGLE